MMEYRPVLKVVLGRLTVGGGRGGRPKGPARSGVVNFSWTTSHVRGLSILEAPRLKPPSVRPTNRAFVAPLRWCFSSSSSSPSKSPTSIPPSNTTSSSTSSTTSSQSPSAPSSSSYSTSSPSHSSPAESSSKPPPSSSAGSSSSSGSPSGGSSGPSSGSGQSSGSEGGGDGKGNTSEESGVSVMIRHGLPQVTVSLPSRQERCRFTLRPVTQTVQDFVEQLQAEDRGIDRAVLFTEDGIRIASSCSIEHLLTDNFNLTINEKNFKVTVPPRSRDTMEEVSDLGDVRQLVGNLYAALNIDEHQLRRERTIIKGIEEVKMQLMPLEKKREDLVSVAERRTTILSWTGLGFMAVQFGFLARLTWWEYSWDIMEPVTYFVTYGTSMAAFAYYVITRQDFILPEVRDRQFLLSFHRRARKVGLNVNSYNHLKERLALLEGDLARLRDPLALNLPPKKLEQDPTVHDVMHKAQITIKNLFGMNKEKLK